MLNQIFIPFYTVIRTEVIKIFRVWAQTLLPATITTTLYFLIFGHIIGQRIGTMGGIPYLQFIAPGLIMMTMLTSAFNASVSLFYMYKWSRVIEEMLVSPMSSGVILSSFVAVGVLRALIVGAIVSTIAAIFTHYTIAHFAYMILVSLLASGIFACFGVLNAVYAKSFDQINIVPTFIITPLTYLGGVFYSISILPAFWQKVAMFNPIIYIISTFRYAFYGHADANIFNATLVMIGIFVALYVVCYQMIRARKGVSG